MQQQQVEELKQQVLQLQLTVKPMDLEVLGVLVFLVLLHMEGVVEVEQEVLVEMLHHQQLELEGVEKVLILQGAPHIMLVEVVALVVVLVL